ncbi:MAG: co-chaperone GroES [Anaerosomatales bacterium]|jgi:chaperonin GroES|uniref:co-chaperone GroES n=1 Tax=Parvivirga hydrogeniphila TaxID=2939460 RepID=UPI0009C664E2|nr:co-chaperone GroES [Parvivirga hydrogeniphila]MBC7265894.1 co-chaperone GroES [Coriobacteriia bacterium]MDI6692465.1 co-chaperone GroES [Anaerosomatales bacterium]GAV30752.1 protein Cpn10 [Coriobacteriaceae bacterium EMTCatB1]MCL4078592.1 co-chaperone GroES [Parvivirga hydrogeniphila]MCX8007976.1 co-chaperone GroES [Coriobacteriia bacterium]
MKLKPLFDNIVVKPAKAEEQTKSGLIIPDTAQEKPKQGEVIAVGDGRWDDEGEKRVPMDVKVGDKVIYKEWGKTSVKIDGEEYFIMSQGDVLAIIEQ